MGIGNVLNVQRKVHGSKMQELSPSMVFSSQASYKQRRGQDQ